MCEFIADVTCCITQWSEARVFGFDPPKLWEPRAWKISDTRVISRVSDNVARDVTITGIYGHLEISLMSCESCRDGKVVLSSDFTNHLDPVDIF